MSPRVLIVDDELDFLKGVVFRLKRAGYEIATADNGAQALDSVANSPPDLILLDIKMPILDGLEVCRRLKADPKWKEIPVIFMTAHVIDPELRTREAGADDYMIKPFENEELLAKVKKFIG